MKKPTKQSIKKSGERTCVDNHRNEKSKKISTTRPPQKKPRSIYPHYNLLNDYAIAITHELPKKIFHEILDFNTEKNKQEKKVAMLPIKNKSNKTLLGWSKELNNKIKSLMLKLEEGRLQGVYLLES